MTRLLQVLPSVVREVDGEFEVDADFRESLKVSLQSFDEVSVACPITKEVGDAGLRRCTPIKDLPWRERVKFIPLPNGYRLNDFVRHYIPVRRTLKAEIKHSDYLVFSPHTLIGDWPTIAVREAIKLQRPYVIEADVVYESLAKVGTDLYPLWKRFIKNDILLPLFLKSYRYCLTNSKLALFQGQDVHDAYAPYCSNPQKVYHHIPIYKGGHITDSELRTKLARLKTGQPLNICYAGRAISMKGPMDWIDTLIELIGCGVKLHATWIGDGTLLADMKAKVQVRGFAEHFSFPGFIDQPQVLQTIKDSDVFLFCHKSQESARCLGEALAAGCPLVGYDSAYPAELVAQHGGGLLVDPGDWPELANLIQYLDVNRDELGYLITHAAMSGQLFDREARLHDRANSIRTG